MVGAAGDPPQNWRGSSDTGAKADNFGEA